MALKHVRIGGGVRAVGLLALAFLWPGLSRAQFIEESAPVMIESSSAPPSVLANEPAADLIEPEPSPSDVAEPLAAVKPAKATDASIIDFNPWRPKRPQRYIEAEYLLWWAGDSKLPALLNSNPDGTSIPDAGLPGPSTSLLYGNEKVGDWPHSGVRLRGGRYIGESGISRVEVDGHYLFQGTDSFAIRSVDGDEILSRPFFNSGLGQFDAQLLNYPGIADGRFSSEYKRQAFGFDPLLFFCLSSDQCRWTEFYTGYRFFWLQDNIELSERIDIPAGGLVAPGTYFDIEDEFTATNIYNMIPLGLSFSGNRGNWIWNLRGDIGLGIVSQQVKIRGQSDFYVDNERDSREDVGFLALQTNRGKHDRTRFAWVPQLSANMKRQLGDRTSVQLGYTLMYLDNVVKAVDHIPTVIDPGNLPTPTPGAGPEPRFAFHDSSILIHGFNFGLQFEY